MKISPLTIIRHLLRKCFVLLFPKSVSNFQFVDDAMLGRLTPSWFAWISKANTNIV